MVVEEAPVLIDGTGRASDAKHDRQGVGLAVDAGARVNADYDLGTGEAVGRQIVDAVAEGGRSLATRVALPASAVWKLTSLILGGASHRHRATIGRRVRPIRTLIGLGPVGPAYIAPGPVAGGWRRRSSRRKPPVGAAASFSCLISREDALSRPPASPDFAP